MRSLVLPFFLAIAGIAGAAPLAAPKTVAPAKVAAVDTKGAHGDPELQSLRRQLASAVLLAELKLTAEQKTAMKSVLAEARKLRDEKMSDPALATFRAGRMVALRAALDEVRKTGSLSEKTRASMNEDAHDDMDELRDKVKELRESVMGILTPAQIEHMKELRENKLKKMKKMGKDGGGKGHAGKAGKGRILRLVLSDEFAAELDR